MNDPSSLFSALEKVTDHLSKVQRETKLAVTLEESGVVTEVGQGVILIDGLPQVKSGELVQFTDQFYGIAFNLETDRVGVVFLDRTENIQVGMHVKRTHRVLEIGVGDTLVGRLIDPLGRPLDQKKPPLLKEMRPIEKKAPSLIDRLPVIDPLLTGIQAIDAMIPIGRGQRELILGDRQTGKTSLAIDTIINQKNQDVICIYCSIGKEMSEVKRITRDLKENNALDHTIMIAASGKDAPGLNYIAPYAAMTIAEYFMEKGRDTLIIFDDLTRHAWSYREISLLLRRPPTREAYPGDIFFIHSRLLERATKLKKEKGGGSITALPIIETEEQNIAAYIPTNHISITDGQVYLSPELYQEGILPAIDIGKSVSRVGGKTQLPSYRRLAKDLRLSYAQYTELAFFSRFGTRLDEETKRKIERGNRVKEVLKQDRLKPLPIADQIAFLTLLVEGFFDHVPTQEIHRIKKRIQTSIYQELSDSAEKMNRGEELPESEMAEFIDRLSSLFYKE